MSTLYQRALRRLHAQGGRMTRQRRLIIETLAEMSGHPTAEELFARVRVREPRIHLSTVYRTLRWLQEERLIQGRRFEDQPRLERFDPNLPADHFHFLCRQCGAVIEFDPPPESQAILQRFAARSGCQVTSATMTLYGLCPDCQSE